MARPKKVKRSSYKLKTSDLSIDGGSGPNKKSFFEKIQSDLEDRQSVVSLVLGALIIIIVGILLYNYFNKPSGDLGPSQQTEDETSGDVAKEDLPGQYTIKAEDTLFSIAQKYYDDGYKYTAIAEANNLTDPNAIEAGQVLQIPKLEDQSTVLPVESALPSPSPSEEVQVMEQEAKGGAENQTVWGESITANTYTVVEGDWLSTIAGRAYGDIYAYDKLAKANNIANPDLIEIGMTLKIPR